MLVFGLKKREIKSSQTISQFEIELRRLAKDCEFHGYDDEMILDRLLSTCCDEKSQDEALAKDWDLKTLMKHATMKQDIKAQTDDMKSERREESAAFSRAANVGKPKGRAPKQKMYSF